MTDAPDDQIPTSGSDALVAEFQARRERLDQRLITLEELIGDLRRDLQGDSQASLLRLAQAARDMANGQVYQKIDIEAKGELGALVSSINQTLLNLQQLDASVKHQSTQVPELAAQLDAITSDTEEATQSVMNRLDTLMAASDDATRSLEACQKGLNEQSQRQAHLQEAVTGFLDRAAGGEDRTALAQEVLEFLFAQQVTAPAAATDLAPTKALLQQVSDEAFEILNILQFQDITRQKIEKVVILLKQFQSGLNRLLVIFNIHSGAMSGEGFAERRVATQDHIFETSLEADSRKDSVDDIIAQFKKTGGN
ncbi:methyl-accepting chemotaxis protein [Geothrix sp.]|jgi:chemotaxis regulatin CheY-phosphate phosphatase CheZ|uniref:methyl-accepting chemotaxis protein n=1 Tax=Geothrix sp. TaxID=1962974 RepID=UPI0025C56536|nr:methyl-accepting chemotaxis protein [Geothrix sp.]